MWECHYNGFRMMAPTVDSEIAIDMVNFRRCLPVRKARGSEWLIAVGTDPKKRLLLLSEGLWNEGWHGLLGMTVDSLPDVRG